MPIRRILSTSLCLALLSACEGEHGRPPPPPLPPAAPASTAAPLAPNASPQASAEAARVNETERERASRVPEAHTDKSRTPSKAAPTRKSKEVEVQASAQPSPHPAASPAPAAPEPARARALGKVQVPGTAHVRIDVPAGLQAELDRDPRMQPWANQVVSVIDRCCIEAQRQSRVAGTIEVLVTMHENARPDADIKKLPPALTPIVGCATGGLLRTKMPLFTGKEGARHLVRIQLQ